MRVPSVTAIAETGDTQSVMPRSQSYSVGHGMKASQYNDKTDDIRYMLSQPLLTDAGREIKPLSESRRRSSGTLSRPDIFYQVKKSNKFKISTHNKVIQSDIVFAVKHMVR